MSAYVKTSEVAGSAGLLMRIDGPNGMLGISNMQSWPIQGTTDWTRYSVVLDVPQDSAAIMFGVWLSGSGNLAFDDFRFEAVGKDVPVTQ